MTSKEALNNMQYMLERTDNLIFYKEEIEAIKKDLELLDCFLNCFKSAILEATDSQNRRGDNILADNLRDELGLITLNKLKERLENE